MYYVFNILWNSITALHAWHLQICDSINMHKTKVLEISDILFMFLLGKVRSTRVHLRLLVGFVLLNFLFSV